MSEVVLIGGMPAGGKTTIANTFVEKGYTRLNRDILGGKTNDLINPMIVALKAGKNVVMDNLYATKESRAEVIKQATKIGSKVSLVLLDTSLEDAQFNACCRMLEKYGKILHSEDLKNDPYKDDPNAFPVAVIYKYRKEFEKPTLDEGFEKITTEKFVRVLPTDWVNEAVIFDFDGTLRTHVGKEKYPVAPKEVRVKKSCLTKLNRLKNLGILFLGASNQSGIAKGILTKEDAEACFLETTKQLGMEFKEILYCPHAIPPITCYCRKPGVGMLVELMWKYKLNPKKSIFVGDQKTDETCAIRCGMNFEYADKFFK